MTMTPDQEITLCGTVARIEQKIDGHMETAAVQSAQQTTINRDLYEKYAIQDQFRSRVKGVSKGASMVTGFVALVVGIWSKSKGLW